MPPLEFKERLILQQAKSKAEMPGKPNYLCVPAALKELEKIELIRQPNGNYKQEELLKAIDKNTRTKAEILAFLESHA
ncbi:MAG: hypothetical protein PUG11_06960 [Lactobacillus equicursoris]|nr:hypothetical protein [Lactobacillus equicursoris]